MSYKTAIKTDRQLAIELNENITKNIRSIMAQRKINQEQLANKSGISQSQISKRFNNKIFYCVDDLAKFAKALRCTTLQLIK